jgi:hypothetical protein
VTATNGDSATPPPPCSRSDSLYIKEGDASISCSWLSTKQSAGMQAATEETGTEEATMEEAAAAQLLSIFDEGIARQTIPDRHCL